MIVLENVLTSQELASVREFLSQAPFEDGKATADASIRERKANQQLKRNGAVSVDPIIQRAFIRHSLFQAWAMPMRMSIPLFNRYGEGMFYRQHVDSPFGSTNPPMRCDISVTLFLSEPAEYDGGELVIETHTGPTAVKLAAGSAFAYLTTALHAVNKITRGERLAAVNWVQSTVPDDRFRDILFDLTIVEHSVASVMKETVAYSHITKARQNLERLAARP